MAISAQMKITKDKYLESGTALLEHLDARNDDKGIELLREFVDYHQMALQLMGDGLAELQKRQTT